MAPLEATEEVIATVETGNGEHSFIHYQVKDSSSSIIRGEENITEEVVDNITEEEVVEEEEEAAYITDTYVLEQNTEHPSMEHRENIPNNETLAETEALNNTNIPYEEDTNDRVVDKPVNNLPEEEISTEDETHSVQMTVLSDDETNEPTKVFQTSSESLSPTHIPNSPTSGPLKNMVESTITRTTLGSTTIGSTVVPTLRTTITTSHPPPSLLIPKPPQTEILLQTAREVLQLPEEPGDCKGFLMQQQDQTAAMMGMAAGPVITETVISSGHQGGGVNTMPDQRLSLEEENSLQMEVSDENATYILEPVSNEEYYQDDQNIMWIQETVEVEQQESYDSLPNMVIILNPNGTVNEELMLAHGMNLETIKAVTDNVINLQVLGQSSPDLNLGIKSLQYPIPKKELIDVKPLFSNMAPRGVVDGAIMKQEQEQEHTPTTEHSRSVILDAKDNFLVLDELDNGGTRDPMIEPLELGLGNHRIVSINGTNHIVTSPPGKHLPDLKRAYFRDQNGQEMQFNLSSLPPMTLPMTPLGTLDLSLPKKPDPMQSMDQYVNPSALVSENSVLKALQGQGLAGKGGVVRAAGGKIKKPKTRDENGNGTPYIHRKTTSLGALGQALHGQMLGIPRDSRENAVQICPLCKFQATTKNPYRHLQDHLARMHFKERIAADLPTKKPYICPMDGCDNKHYPDWQAVMRHYIGKKHGILDKFVKETLSECDFQGLQGLL